MVLPYNGIRWGIIGSIKIIRSGDVRRAKLYYLRSRKGKSARISEKIKKRIGVDVSQQENLNEIAPETSVINDKSAKKPKKENPKKDAEPKTKLKKEK